MQDLLQQAKKEPGRIDYASSGSGSAGHLLMELLQRATNVQLTHVPYKGAAPALQDVLAGIVSVIVVPSSVALAAVRDGKLKVLAVSSPQRSPQAPGVPTFAELGLSPLTVTSWIGLSVPKGTPQAFVRKLNAVLQAAMADDALLKQLEADGLTPMTMTPQQYTQHVQILLHVAELGSIQRTASAVGLTQSSVTQTLAYLENLLELPLFERHSRGVRPTPLCMDLLPVARQLMLGVMNGAEVIAARRRKGEGTVRLIGSAAAINGLLLSALPAFSEQYPVIQVRLREAEGEDQLLAVARGEVDLVVCRRPSIIPEGWEFHPLREDRLVVVCRSMHPLARARAIRPSDLADQTWLLLPAGSHARRQFNEFSKALPKMPATYPVVTGSGKAASDEPSEVFGLFQVFEKPLQPSGQS